MRNGAVLLTVSSVAALFAFLVVRFVNVGRESDLDYQTFQGDELGVVLVVSPTCGACWNSSLHEAWPALLEKAQTEAGRREARLSVTALGLSRVPDRSLGLLKKSGDFHEVILGKGWQSTGAMKFIHGRLGGPAVTPQIVLPERTNVTTAEGRPAFEKERVLRRYVGIDNITRAATLTGAQLFRD